MFFRNREAGTVEVIRQKLATAVEEEARAEQGLKDAALAAALSPDPFAAEPQREALRRAREKVELLQAALEAAEYAERQAIARAKAALRASQNRAIRQKVGAVVKASGRYQEATAAAVVAYREMVAAGEDIKKLLPPGFHDFAVAASIPALERYCVAELGRVGAENPGRLDKSIPIAPNAEWNHPDVRHGSTVRDLPPLADRLKDRLLQHYRHLVGAAPPPVAIDEPEPRRKPARSPDFSTPAVALSPADPIPPAKPTAAVVEPSAAGPVAIDLDRIHPDDAEARAGFALELAVARGELDLAPVADPTEGDLVETTDADAEPIEADPLPLAEAVEAAADTMAPVETVETEAAQPPIRQVLAHMIRR